MLRCVVLALLSGSACSLRERSLDVRGALARKAPAQSAKAQPTQPTPPAHSLTGAAGARQRLASGSSSNASLTSNASANATIPFSPHDYPPAIGKVFAFYYSSTSGQKVTQIEARSYKGLSEKPSDPAVFDPATGFRLVRGDCPLRITAHTSYPSDQRKSNLRMAELAVCAAFMGYPCANDAKGCELEVYAPLPYSEDQEPYVGAGIALTAHSLLCAQRTESWKLDSCKITRSEAALSAGLTPSGSSIVLRPLPEPWVDLKLDDCYQLGFKEVVLARANKDHYYDSENYAKKSDVLAWTREPPEPKFCGNLPCLVQLLER